MGAREDRGASLEPYLGAVDAYMRAGERIVMKELLWRMALAFSMAMAAECQTLPPDPPQQVAPQPASPAQTQSEPQQSPQGAANDSAIKVKPGGEAIKDKDLWEKTGYIHPFVRMPRYILQDQKAIWTSPVHTAKSDVKWWAIFGAATGALIATDKWTAKQLPNTNAQVRLGNYTSNLGAAYTLIPIGAGFYFLGTAKHSERFRETGLLAFETLIDTTIIETIVKSATDRARPLEGNGNGGFWNGKSGIYNASFPSGHAINTFGLASVFAHEYHDKWWVKVLAYGYAGTVVGARLAARRHFPGDVVAGGALGWFVGDYVYAKRHNPELDKKLGTMQNILAHVRIGGPEF
jgi:membrane-associated phospholipid phosphatase